MSRTDWRLNPKPQTKNINVFCAERYDGDWPPEDAAGFIAWFQAKLDSIPAEHRASAAIKIDSNSSWEDSHYADIEINYTRLETADEVAARIAEAKRELAAAQERERRNYEALKRKYG